MLVADPSSACDICFENFSSSRECWCIPCGHVFCRDCLNRITQPMCPMCRTPLVKSNLLFRPARKLHLDLSKCGAKPLAAASRDSRSTHSLKKLEQRLVSETLETDHGLSVKRTEKLANEVDEFLKKHPLEEHDLLRIIESLLRQLSTSMARVYEDTALSKAVKTSYEQQIQQLEKSLKEQTRQLSGGERSGRLHGERSGHSRGDAPKHTSRLRRTSPRPQATQPRGILKSPISGP